MTTMAEGDSFPFRLDEPIAIPDLARVYNKPVRRMRRALMRLHRAAGDKLLIRINNRWFVKSILVLREHGWASAGRSPQREQTAIEQDVKALRRDLRAAQARVRELEKWQELATPLLERGFQQQSLGWMRQQAAKAGAAVDDEGDDAPRTREEERRAEVLDLFADVGDPASAPARVR